MAIAWATAAVFGAQHVQSPDATWKTIHTRHYRIHYPASGDFEGFAKAVAGRVEGIHDLMKPWVGYEFPGPTDIVVMDPVAAANGSTTAMRNRPFIILWRTPPDSDGGIAHGHDWVDMLVPHEMVHLHHLTWANRQTGLYERLQWVPQTSKVAWKCPAWLTEGYATLLEGRLTGMGRPHGLYRANILRLLAREGRLPRYKDLDKGPGRYLVSSAFLGWLEQHGPAKAKAFPELWLRLSSSRYPTFEAGFQATFGQGPEIAYTRFCAELTHDALEMERKVTQAGLREGTLWSYVPHPVLNLSLSPDGTRLLARLQDPKNGGFWLWDIQAPLANASTKAKDRKRDPDLPEEAPDLFPEREVSDRLSSIDGQVPEHPHWAAGGVRYRVRQSDEEGVQHFVERTWKVENLSTTAPTIEYLYPKLDGSKWMILAEGKRLSLPFEPFGPVSWDRTTRMLYASKAVQGIASIVRLSFDPASLNPFGEATILTRTASAALAPAPTPDGKALFFIIPRLEGAEIRRLELKDATRSLTPWAEASDLYAPGTIRPPADEASLLPNPTEPPPARAYRVLDSHHVSVRIGGTDSPSGHSTQIGLGGQDILPRLDWEVVASIEDAGTNGARGAFAGGTWRGWTWAPRLQVFSEYDRPSQQKFLPVQGWDQEHRGIELGVGRDWLNLGDGLRVQGALATERVESIDSGNYVSRALAWSKARQKTTWEQNGWQFTAGGEAQGALGRTSADKWNLTRALVTFGGGYRWAAVQLIGEAGRINGQPTRLDRFQFGGQDQGLSPSSLQVNTVFQPALPAHLESGDRFARWRAETPFGLYIEGSSVWDGMQARPSFLRVMGLEAHFDSRDFAPYVNNFIRKFFGALEFRVGIHEALDGPTRHKGVYTYGLLARF
jgi:hypothetical protein